MNAVPSAGLNWQRSSACPNMNCVEVASAAGGELIFIRSTTKPDHVIAVSAGDFRDFRDGVVHGDFEF